MDMKSVASLTSTYTDQPALIAGNKYNNNKKNKPCHIFKPKKQPQRGIYVSNPGISMWIPESELQTEGLATCCGHSVKQISLSRPSPPWEAVRMELLLYFCWCHTLSVTQKQSLKIIWQHRVLIKNPSHERHNDCVCLCVRKKQRKGREKGESVYIAHLSIVCQSTEHVVQSSTWTVQHHETLRECTVADEGASRSAMCSHSGCVCLPLGFLSLSAVWPFRTRYHGCFGLSSFIKGSGVSESLWCFLSRGGSTLLQRVHEGERM